MVAYDRPMAQRSGLPQPISRSTWIAVVAGLAIILVGIVIGLIVDSAGRRPAVITAVPTTSSPPIVLKSSPPKKSLDDQFAEATTLPAALALARPHMADTAERLDDGTLMLAWWAAKSLQWSDVSVVQSDTSFAVVMKDPDEARGLLMCVAGSIVEIEAVKTKAGKIFDGLFHDAAGHLYKFAAVGSSGTLVANSGMRFCGVVTGKFDYSNSGGGTGHAIKLVGMFDLPANRGPR